MKDRSPLPRPVDVAFPPRATVIAESTALFPPIMHPLDGRHLKILLY